MLLIYHVILSTFRRGKLAVIRYILISALLMQGNYGYLSRAHATRGSGAQLLDLILLILIYP